MVELAESEREILVIGRDLMTRLVTADDWLPEAFSPASSNQVQDHLLYQDGEERFSVVASIFSGGQATPIRREPVWEIVGVLRGSLTRQRFGIEAGKPPAPKTEAVKLLPGAIDIYATKSGDALQMTNALADGISISVHAYGGELGKLPRQTFDANGAARDCVAAYANGEDAPAYDIWSIQTEILD
jgi:predicted metal-dependent enzyme (double-stranded beta helix superfamily)